MSDVVSDSAAGAGGEGFEALAGLNDGFLGTGHSTAVELSIAAMVLIGGYVAYGTVRYFLPDLRLLERVTDALGLGDR